MSKVEAYKKLIRQFYAGSLEGTAKENFAKYFEDSEFLEAWEQLMEEELDENTSFKEPDSAFLFFKIKNDERVKDVLTDIPNHSSSKIKIIKSIVAAAVMLLVGIVAFLIWNEHNKTDNLAYNQIVDAELEVLPGTNKAQIILENGSRIDLEKIKGDTVIDNGDFEIVKTADGSISYRAKYPSNEVSKLVYNTIVTPGGGEYKLNLPDGTRVWLNAKTVLRYPVQFNKQIREIEMTGEAYFEIAKQIYQGKRVPFIIHTGAQKLEVLGTVFNLQNYGQNIVTTLLEGKVKLNFKDGSQEEQYLLPDEQTTFNSADQRVKKIQVDPFYFSAWKDGKFAFEKIAIEEVMATISRWYDVEVIFKDQLTDFQFSGTISKYEDINRLLQTIELVGGIHFQLKGRRIYVMK
ncbi:FecR family protein [Sphingobacterium faecium]|uniref:FecR family protein n=1 Tax=Sphingobacterium faecium TaxID=34087 RepID=UPI002468A4B9|nr:FecR family protein [Sphingobacterium faecium]MDH5826233.1 DUF4974 domain-containing protein [Sphingobacterium faecium]